MKIPFKPEDECYIELNLKYPYFKLNTMLENMLYLKFNLQFKLNYSKYLYEIHPLIANMVDS